MEEAQAPPHSAWRLTLGPLLAIVIALAPLDLAANAHLLLAILVWAVCYWVTEAIPAPATALLAPMLCVLGSLGSIKEVLAPFADPVVFLFIGSFMVAGAMQQYGLDHRLALAMLSQRWATRSPAGLLLVMGLITCLLSLWMSNTATTAMMLPIGLGVLAALGQGRDQGIGKTPYATAMMLMLTWGSSVAVGLPIGSPPNLIAISMARELAHSPLTFAAWVQVAMPLTFAMLFLCYGLLHWLYRDTSLSTAGLAEYVVRERSQLGPWSRGQKSVGGVFLLLATLWLAPASLTAVFGSTHAVAVWTERHLPEAGAALLAACLLFCLPGNQPRQAVLSWRQAARIDWGTILLFGGGLSLGKLLFETRLADTLGRAVTVHLGISDLWGITAVAVVLGIIISEAASNTASASAIIPAVIAVAAAAGVSPLPPLLGAALGASFGFMLPVSTPPNAIVYSSGLVPLRQMIRAGIWLDLLGGLLIWLYLRLVCPLLGMA
jgi:sodium-dependent dicarboxylate transporter 2/3/5